MTYRTTGQYPSEFDRTTNAVLSTVQYLGVTDEVLADDQVFLVNMMLMIGATDTQKIPMEDTIRIMDMAYIGLVYHRHMPFVDEETEEKVLLSDADPTGYTRTLSTLSNALVEQQGVAPEQIIQCATDATMEALRNLRPPETLDQDGTRLHTDFIALSIIGLMVHRLVPSTDQQP